MKNSSDTVENRTRDLPACSAVPQPTAPPRTALVKVVTLNGQAQSSKFSPETVTFMIMFVFIKILKDSKQNTITHMFVGQIPLSLTSTFCL